RCIDLAATLTTAVPPIGRRSYQFVLTRRRSPGLYTISLHDALPIWRLRHRCWLRMRARARALRPREALLLELRAKELHRAKLEKDRKSTRLNSSHVKISYAVFCLKKKQTINT